MCINLQRFPNPRFRGVRPTSFPFPFTGDSERYFINVPCGKCIECSDAKRNDLFVRASYEYHNLIRHNGEAYFVTLTYNNKCVPRFRHRTCFNRSDVTTFLRRLRARHFKFCKKFGYKYHGLRYFVTSEYGHETHRPHYHMVLFNYAPVNQYLIPYLVKSTWLFGMVNVQTLQSNVGINYVAKYAGKDINNLRGDFDITYAIKLYKGSLSCQPWYQEKSCHNSIRTYEDFVQTYKGRDKDFDSWYQKLTKLRQRKQFYLCSKHLGHAGLSDFVTLRDCVYGNTISVPSSSSQFSIPQSFVKRACNTTLGANYLQRQISAENSLKNLLFKIGNYETINNVEILDWKAIFPFDRESFMLSPVSTFGHFLDFAEYNPLTLCWCIRHQSFSPRSYFKCLVDLDIKLNNNYLYHNDFTIESDFDFLKEHYRERDFFVIDNPITIEMMTRFYDFQSKIPDIVKLINSKPYETKLKNRFDYSHKVSIAPTYV